MDDTERFAHLVGGLVCCLQTGEHLTRDRNRDVDRHVGLRFMRGTQQPVQRHAVHVLLNEHDFIAGRHHVEHGHDVAVMDLRSDACLVEEHRDEVGVLGELGMQSLRRDDAREAFIADEARDVNRRHATARDLAMQYVTPHRHRPAGMFG